ncbi:hypothetical protein [Symbiobacterium terraclitae]|uniref:hypothetical protein n=1 Tax=Symbiobacterium terraclitae TaxID=557451 RepID=UPI001AE408A7|nr:hypothetical protein [Symbiobacterium terraclitae]
MSVSALEVYLYGRASRAAEALQSELVRVAAEGVHPAAGLTLDPELAGALVRERLVVRLNGRLVPGPGLVWISAGLREELLQVLQPVQERYLKILEAGIPLLQESAAADGSGPWEALEHVVVAGLLIDMGVRRHLIGQGLVRQQPRSCWLWAFEGTTLGRHKFGVRLWHDRELPFGIGQLWYGYSRPHPKFSKADLSALAAVLETGTACDAEANVLRLRARGLIRRDGETHVPAVPVLVCADDRRLWGEIDRLAAEVVREAISPAQTALGVLAKHLPMVPRDSFVQASMRLLMEHVLDAAVDGGLLRPLPVEAPPHYGFWLWREDASRRFTESLGNWMEVGSA